MLHHSLRQLTVFPRRPCFAFAVAAIFLVFPLAAQAQSGGGVDPTGTGGIHRIQGRIYFRSGRRSDLRLPVRLESYNSGQLSALSDANGTFAFRGLIPGSYTIVLEGGGQYETVRETVYIDSEGVRSRGAIRVPSVPRLYTVQISLELKRKSGIRFGVVNATLAGVPPAARDLYEKALEDSLVGDSKKAVERLKGALSLHSEFPLALNELGVQYLQLGQAESAAETLSRAIKLAPEDFLPRLNYGIALLNLPRTADAEVQLRASISLNSSISTAHMYLGIALAIQRKLEAAEKELTTAIKSGSRE